MWPQSFWKHVYEPVIRKSAGLGKAATERDPDTYEHMHAHVDVLVVGGGIAGLTAAEAAAQAGARVLLADENPMLGGIADLMAGSVDGVSTQDHALAIAERLKAMPNVQVMSRTTVVGHFHHNYLMMFERVAEHAPALLASRCTAPPLVEGACGSRHPRHGRTRTPHRLCQQRPPRHHHGICCARAS